MQKRILLATFKEQLDAQGVINQLTASGFDSDNISLLMLDKPDKASLDEDGVFDEEDFPNEAKGTLEPIQGISLTGDPLSLGDTGSIIVGGPLTVQVEESEEIMNDEQEYALDKTLLLLNIPFEEVESFEGRVLNNEIILAVEVTDENEEEIMAIFSDNGPEVMEVFES